MTPTPTLTPYFYDISVPAGDFWGFVVVVVFFLIVLVVLSRVLRSFRDL